MPHSTSRPASGGLGWGWLLVLVLLGCQTVACVVGSGPSLRGVVDLRAYYAAGEIVRTGQGHQLYDYDYQQQVQNVAVSPRANALPFLYPSFAAVPFVPLSMLSYRSAFIVLLVVNLGLLLLSAYLLRPWLCFFRGAGWFVLPAFYGCLFGVSIALMQGQLSFALLAVYCGAWVLLRQDRRFLAGLLVSVGLIKFQIALPVVFLFLLWRQWKFVAGFVVGSIALLGTSFAIVGKVGVLAYWHSMSGMTKQTALDAAAAKEHYGMFPVDMPNLHGLTFGLSHGAHWGLFLNVALCCAVLGFAATRRASLLVALPAAMLVSYHMQPHDLTLLLLPLSFEVDGLLGRRRGGGGSEGLMSRGLERTLLISLLLLVLPLAAVVMAHGLNYVVSVAVCVVMIVASRLNVGKSAMTG